MARYAANGTLLKRGDGGTPTELFATIANLKTIGGPTLASDTIETTAHGDTLRTYIAGIRDAGEVTLDGFLDPADVAGDGLRSDLVAGTKRNFQLVFPTTPNKTWAFAGIITKFDMTAPFEAELGFSATIKISGTPTIT